MSFTLPRSSTLAANTYSAWTARRIDRGKGKGGEVGGGSSQLSGWNSRIAGKAYWWMGEKRFQSESEREREKERERKRERERERERDRASVIGTWYLYVYMCM